MKQYLELMKHVREHGRYKQDRTGTGTYGVFGYQMRFDLTNGQFPLVTTKKCHLRSIIHELLWFLQGDTNIRYLKENGVSIWDEWVKEGTAEYVQMTTEEIKAKLKKRFEVKIIVGIDIKLQQPDIDFSKTGDKVTFTITNDFWEECLAASGGDIDVVNVAHGEVYRRIAEFYGVDTQKLVAGSIGPGYGYQWRSWPTGRNCPTCKGLGELDDAAAGDIMFNRWTCPKCKGKRIETIDQIAKVVETLKTNPDSRRIIVSAWNPAQVDDMALPPCHALFQFYSEPMSRDERLSLFWRDEKYFEHTRRTYGDPQEYGFDDIEDDTLDEYGVPTRRLSCQLYQRSADIFLGVPFNIASYALLVMMVAQVTGHAPGEFVWTGGDCHLYANHLEQVDLQLQREPHALPTMRLNPDVTNLFEFKFSDFTLKGYNPHPHISAPVAV